MRSIITFLFSILFAITLSSCDLFDLFIKDDIEPPKWIVGEWVNTKLELDILFLTNNVKIIRGDNLPIVTPQDIKEHPFKDYYDSDMQYRIESKSGASGFAYTKYVFKRVNENKILFSYIVGISSENYIELFRKD